MHTVSERKSIYLLRFVKPLEKLLPNGHLFQTQACGVSRSVALLPNINVTNIIAPGHWRGEGCGKVRRAAAAIQDILGDESLQKRWANPSPGTWCKRLHK